MKRKSILPSPTLAQALVLLGQGNPTEFRQLFTTYNVHSGPLAHELSRCDAPIALTAFLVIPASIQPKVFGKLPVRIQEYIVLGCPHSLLQQLFTHLSLASLAHFLSGCHAATKKTIDALLTPHILQQLDRITALAIHAVGRIMLDDCPTLAETATIEQALNVLAALRQAEQKFTHLFVIDAQHRLVGYVDVTELILQDKNVLIKNITKECIISAYPEELQEEVALHVESYNLSALPIISRDGTFLGIVTIQDLLTATRQEATRDALVMSGITAEQTAFSYQETPTMTLVKQRLTWLVGLLLFQSISSIILARYELLLQRHVILSLFLTMLIGTGGNAGNQSATLVIRGLVSGEFSWRNARYILTRELLIALILGTILFSITFIRIFLLHRSVQGSFTISASLFAIVVTSISLGTAIPLIFSYARIDPTYSAAPLLATLMDITGVQIYCAVAALLLN